LTLALAVVSALTLFAAGNPLHQRLALVKNTYEQGGDLSASFTQTYIDALRAKKRVEQGRLWATSDGRLRWQYLTPERKDFYFDGKTAYFYEPEKAQVTVFEQFADSPFSQALAFVLGKGDIEKMFDVSACTAHCDLGKGIGAAIDLVPKKTLAAVDHVLIFVDQKTNTVTLSVLFDALGNRTEYRFHELKFHVQTPNKRFIFNKPDGVLEQRATLEQR